MSDFTVLSRALEAGELDAALGRLACLAPGADPGPSRDRVRRVMEGFRARLGEDVPIVVGELGYPENGFTGTPAELLRAFNRRLPALAARLPRCAVASAEGLTCRGDGLHFDTPSLRAFGLRYLAAWQGLR